MISSHKFVVHPGPGGQGARASRVSVSGVVTGGSLNVGMGCPGARLGRVAGSVTIPCASSSVSRVRQECTVLCPVGVVHSRCSQMVRANSFRLKWGNSWTVSCTCANCLRVNRRPLKVVLSKCPQASSRIVSQKPEKKLSAKEPQGDFGSDALINQPVLLLTEKADGSLERKRMPLPLGPQTGGNGFGHFCRNKSVSSCGGDTPHINKEVGSAHPTKKRSPSVLTARRSV